MPAKPRHSLKPRKRPVQARSEATVSALFDASIQVLLMVGYRKFTTTRVAERAGVSVGSLYQYFPNRQALITAVIERYLEGLHTIIQQHCRALRGSTLDRQVGGLVDGVIAAKFEHIDVSRAARAAGRYRGNRARYHIGHQDGGLHRRGSAQLCGCLFPRCRPSCAADRHFLQLCAASGDYRSNRHA